MFERLFKFSKINFSEGEVALEAGSLFSVAVLLVVIAAGFCIVHWATRLYSSNRDRAISLSLRLTALLVLCIPLLQPVLIMPSVVPDENFVAVLVDASESMSLPDGQFAESRGGDVRHLLLDQEDALLPALETDFKLRRYAFAGDAHRTDSLRGTTFSGKSTNLSAALGRVLSDFSGLPLAGIVLLTDGGDNSEAVPLNKAEELRSRGIPLHVVGVGRERFEQEREILSVTPHKSVEEATGAEIDVKVRSWDAEPEPVSFSLYRGDEQVHSEERRLKGGGKIDQFTLFYEPALPDPAEYTLRIDDAPSELNTGNNARSLLIDTREDTMHVLYLEGRLRPDFRYVKRALEDDQAIQVASVSRTGRGSVYRQGISSPEELQGGFPNSTARLYEYEAVLIGDLEASSFSLDQQKALESFVRLRGGGLMMLGGRHTFAEGNYLDMPVADLLPVEIDPSRRTVVPPSFSATDASQEGYRFVPTEAGLESPILRLSPNPDTSLARWQSMPRLTTINYLGDLKPGATLLAQKPKDDFGGSEPLLAVQRYGKGRSAALPTASTWRWQMQLSAEDMRYERFWRQLVRWLAASAPDRVNVDLNQHRTAPGEPLPLRVQVYDAAYAPQNGASVQGELTAPSGAKSEITFQQDLAEPGTYTAPFIPQEEGIHLLKVTAQAADTVIGTQHRSLLSRPPESEFYDATLKRPFLQHLAEVSGGYYYAPEAISDIPENIKNRRTSTSIYRTESLWDMPFLFGLVLLLLSTEWVYRRRRGLP